MEKTAPIDTTNIIPDVRKPEIFYPMIAALIALIISLYVIFYNVKTPTSTSDENKQAGDIVIATIFCILVVIICIALLPNFKEMKQLFGQIHNVTYMILYTIFLILFFLSTRPWRRPRFIPRTRLRVHGRILVAFPDHIRGEGRFLPRCKRCL